MRTLQPNDGWAHADRVRLTARHAQLENVLGDSLRTDVLCTHLTSAMAVTWALRQHGLATAHSQRVIDLARRVSVCARAWREPFRSVFFRWSGRLAVTDGRLADLEYDDRPEGEALASMLMARTHGGIAPLVNTASDWYERLSHGEPSTRAVRLCLIGPHDRRLRSLISCIFNDVDEMMIETKAASHDDHRFACRVVLGFSRLEVPSKKG